MPQKIVKVRYTKYTKVNHIISFLKCRKNTEKSINQIRIKQWDYHLGGALTLIINNKYQQRLGS